MNYTKPFSIATEFHVEFNGQNFQPFIDCCRNNMFESFEIRYTRSNQSCILIKLSTTIQSSDRSRITPEFIVRIEKRFRNDFYKRISAFSEVVICVKETTIVKFSCQAYHLSKKSTKKPKTTRP